MEDADLVSLDQYFENDPTTDDATILMELDEDVVHDNMIEQIKYDGTDDNDTAVPTNSYFEYFEKRWAYLLNKYKDTENEVKEQANSSFNKFVDEIHQLICDKYSYEIGFNSLTSLADKAAYVKAEYKFFILHAEEKLAEFGCSYITTNMDSFLKIFAQEEINGKPAKKSYKKNLSYKALAQSMDNEYTPVVFFVEQIIKMMDLDGEDIMRLAVQYEPDEYLNFIIDKLFNQQVDADFVIYKKFSQKIIKRIVEDPGVLNSIKTKLINTYSEHKEDNQEDE